MMNLPINRFLFFIVLLRLNVFFEPAESLLAQLRQDGLWFV